MDADPLIYKSSSTLHEVKEVVARLRGDKAAGICNISVEPLKVEGEAMICRLHVVFTFIWQPGTLLPAS